MLEIDLCHYANSAPDEEWEEQEQQLQERLS